MKNIKVLILEDNTTDADLLIRQLTRSGMIFTSKIVEQKEAFENSLDVFCPDIVLSDYSLPAFDAVSAFRILKNKNLDIPFIIVSGTIGEENAVMLIKDGVTDFASKNNLVTLPQKITRALKEAKESHEKKDILERLKIQTAALLTANDELVFQNNEKEKRAVELLNANKELMAFNFISSHDLQEPLRKIQMFTSMMDEEKANMTETGRRNLERIEAAATRMRRLIKDLLAFSRVSSAERQYEMADIAAILEDVKSELKDSLQEKQAIIEAVGLLPVNAVVFQLRQLIYNLLSNSLKFSTPSLPLRVTIETRIIKRHDIIASGPLALLQKCDYWNLSFKDNGVGFEYHFNERIFLMFQKLHSAQEYPGTGIGLAIVKKIVDNHEGIIVAKSALNKGATFNIYIPIHKN